MGKLTFDPVIGSTPTILTIVALLLALAWWVGRGGESGEVSPSQRRWLHVLRMLGLLILLLGIIRPAYIRTDRLPTAATLAVLVDSSRSMTLQANAKQTRWEVEGEVWGKLEPAFRDAGELVEPRIYLYDQDVRLAVLDEMRDMFRKSPEGNSTDLSGSLANVLRESSGRPLAAVVLMGDGTQTATSGGPAAAATARSLAALDVPLWTVPIGPRLSAGQTRDLAIQDLPDQFRVFTKNRFEIAATLQARGFVGRNLPIKLELIDGAGKRRELATRELAPTNADESLPIRIDATAPEPGSYRLELSAALQEGEILTDNNRMVAFLDVNEGGGRVLYLEGQLSAEQKFLRRAINESEDLQLAFRWLEEPTRGDWQPVDLSLDLKTDRYDVFVIGDLPAAAIGNDQLLMMANWVAKGKSLLMLGGYQSFDAGGYGDTPLANVLPVQMRKGVARGGRQNDPSFEISGMLQPQTTIAHPITLLSDGGDSAAIWRRLPPIPGGTRLGPPKPVPGISVLLADEKKQPLLVVGEFGKGRVAALGLDSTWQWWMQGHSLKHRRFWRQLMLWLLARDERASGHVWVEIDRRRWSADESVEFRAGLEDAGEANIELIAELVPNRGPPIPVQLTRGITGETKTVLGKLEKLEPGFYLLRVSTAAPGIQPAEIAVQVTSADRELSRPAADLAQLEQLAELTKNSGGKAYDPNNVDELVQKIRDLRQRAVVPVIKRYRLGDSPLSGGLLLLCLLGVLTTEWILRRRLQLP